MVFSFIGYESAASTVGTHNIIDVVLVEDVQALDEVVVVGYSTQVKRQMTGAIVSIADEEEVELAISLQGMTPGVEAFRPQNSADVAMIRGNASLAKETGLLYVVDGVIVNEFEVEQAGVNFDGST